MRCFAYTADSQYDHNFSNFPNTNKDDDVYGMLSHTIPLPSLPKDLVFTGENFDQQTSLAEKTVVVFYIGCKLPSPGQCYNVAM